MLKKLIFEFFFLYLFYSSKLVKINLSVKNQTQYYFFNVGFFTLKIQLVLATKVLYLGILQLILKLIAVSKQKE